MDSIVTYQMDLRRNLSSGFYALNAGIDGIPASVHPPLFFIREVFTTYNGSWEISDSRYSVPQWARDRYLRPPNASDYFDEAGAATHLFARVVDERGKPLDMPIAFWSDPSGKTIIDTGEKKSMWANFPISQGYSPASGTQGPWKFAPMYQGFPAEVFVGGGLPYGHHVSTFVVWEYLPNNNGGNGTDMKPPPASESYAGYVEDYLLALYGVGMNSLDDTELIAAMMADAGSVATLVANEVGVDKSQILGALSALYRDVMAVALYTGVAVEDVLDMDNAARELEDFSGE